MGTLKFIGQIFILLFMAVAVVYAGAIVSGVIIHILYPTHEIKCPHLRNEMKHNFIPATKENINKYAEIEHLTPIDKSQPEIVVLMATTTYQDGEEMIQAGDVTDMEAVEYNRRVRECKTANGEF